MKSAAAGDLTVGGAAFAARAFDAGLVDECHLFVHPVVVGGGKPAFGGATTVPLELQEERRFDSGIVYLRHRVRH